MRTGAIRGAESSLSWALGWSEERRFALADALVYTDKFSVASRSCKSK